MQTVDEVEKHVPVREGDYGERVATIEPGGVEYIALRERHGKPIQLFFTWLSPNLEFATVFIGVIAVAFLGLNLWQAATAIIVGTTLGSLSHGVLAAWGPKFGVPMMVESRGAFGFLGNILPAGLNGITASFGWFVVNSVSGAFAVQALFPSINFPFWLAFLIIVVAQVVIATLGHNLIHVFERWALPLLGTVFIIACFFIFIHGNYGFSAGAGVFLSCIVLELAGAVLVTVAGTKWGTADIPTAQLQRAMPDVVYYPTLICIAIGAVAANAINIYSGTMSLVALGIREMGLTLRQRRAMLGILVGVIGYFGGLYLESRGVASQYTNFLLLISYWIATWLAVVFVDYWLRRGDYGDESMFYDTKNLRWQGVVAMAVGLVVSVWLFANIFGLYVGPIANSYPQIGDVTFIVGFVITAALYYAFNLNLRKQTADKRASMGSRAA